MERTPLNTDELRRYIVCLDEWSVSSVCTACVNAASIIESSEIDSYCYNFYLSALRQIFWKRRNRKNFSHRIEAHPRTGCQFSAHNTKVHKIRNELHIAIFSKARFRRRTYLSDTLCFKRSILQLSFSCTFLFIKKEKMCQIK